MARIAGIELQDNWRLDYALTKIKGIGWPLSKEILASLKINPSKKVGDLKPTEVTKLISKFEEYPTEGELLGQVRKNIARLKNIGSYRGMRHVRGLPARGQRTKTNARTKRGKRKTVGAFKKEALVKTQRQKSQKEE